MSCESGKRVVADWGIVLVLLCARTRCWGQQTMQQGIECVSVIGCFVRIGSDTGIAGPETETHEEQDGGGTDISEEPLK